MNIQSIIFITVIVLFAILTTADVVKDVVRYFKSKKMVKKAIDDCFKAIKEKEVK